MSTLKQPALQDGLTWGEGEGETTSNYDAKNRSFQFPFLDNEEQWDLSVSKSFPIDKIVRSPLSPNRTSSMAEAPTEFPSDLANFASELSPIARNRDSDTSDEGEQRIPARAAYLTRGIENIEKTQKEEATVSTEPLTSIISQVRTIPQRSSPISGASISSVVDDLQSARKQVGESSNNFIDKIRNAAHKRKVAVTRSRDSLLAKEQEQLRSIAESKARSESLRSSSNNIHQTADAENILPHHDVNQTKPTIRSRYRKNLDGGFGGVGVPKVKKRPTTTPFSPLLGSRRREKVIVKSLLMPNKSTTNGVQKSRPRTSSIGGEHVNPLSFRPDGKSASAPFASSSLVCDRIKESEQLNDKTRITPMLSFKARPLPSSNGSRGHAGQVGVPKVPKRKVTVPVSPSLGPKRLSKNVIDKAKRLLGTTDSAGESMPASDAKSMKSRTPKPRVRRTASTSTAENSGLLGLNLLDVTPDEKCGGQVAADNQNSTPPNTIAQPFVPRSTDRANKRAAYDAVRDQNLQRRLQDEQHRREEQIKKIHKELAAMSKDLT